MRKPEPRAKTRAPNRCLRVRLEARLKKTRIPVQIDIGFGDAVHPAPLEIDFSCLLTELPVAPVGA